MTLGRAMKRTKPSLFKGDVEDVSSSPFNSSDEEATMKTEQETFCFGGSSVKPICLQRELNQMPMAERELVGQDVFGISSHVPTIDHVILEQFWNAVRAIPEKPAYDLAMELSPDFVQNSKFVKSFLYAVEGKPNQAAKRFVRHFETKLSLFGEQKLVKAIELDDFDEDDMEALLSGGFQVLSSPDIRGRNILFGRYTCMKYKTTDNMIRVLWYLWNAMVEDERDQQSGVVAIGYENGRLPLERYDVSSSSSFPGTHGNEMFQIETTDGGFDKDLARGILRLTMSLPIRPVGYHLCADSVQWQGVVDMVMITICKFVRLRCKFHLGTDQECKYALMTHGIPVHALPVTSEGDVILDNHLQWIESRRQIEQARRESCELDEFME